MIKPFLRTVQAGALASLAAVIGMIANLTSIAQIIPIAMVTIGSLGLIYMMDWMLASIERREQLEELDRQRERDKVQAEELNALKTLVYRVESLELATSHDLYSEKQHQELLAALKRIAENTSSSDTKRLETPENEQTEASEEDIPPEAGNTELQSSNKKPPS